MRTDTNTFRTNVFKSVRAMGINSMRSKIVAKRIASGIEYGSYTRYDGKVYDGTKTLDTLELKLDFCWNGAQIVDVIVDGVRVFGVSTDDCVLVSTEPTEMQKDLRPRLETAMEAVYTAVTEAGRLWDEANPDLDAGEVRRAVVEMDPAVVAARAEYRALRKQSLASNRHAHIAYTHPALYDVYSDDVKDDRGSRPSGHIRYDEVVAYYTRRSEVRAAANDDQEIAAAV